MAIKLTASVAALAALNVPLGFLRREKTKPFSFSWVVCLSANIPLMMATARVSALTRASMVTLAFGCQSIANFYPEERLFSPYPDKDHPGNEPLIPSRKRFEIYNYHPDRIDHLAHITKPPVPPIPPLHKPKEQKKTVEMIEQKRKVDK